MKIKEKIEKGAVHAIFLIEIAGRPPEHIEKALKTIVQHFEKQKQVEVLIKKFHKPEPVEKLFSCFVEIEFLCESFFQLLNLIFDYMPSSIEIIEPEDLKLKIADANAIANDLSTRLHQYDAIAKKERIEKAMLLRKFQEEQKKEKKEKK